MAVKNTVALHRVLAANPRRSIELSSSRMPWRDGCRPMALPAKSITWMRRSAVPTRCRSPTSRQDQASRSAGNTASWFPINDCALRTNSNNPHLPGEIQVTVTLNKVSVGTDVNIVQEGLPDVIPVEACYLGWQQSLENLAKLVEPEIPN